ncbi:MAG: hypothetical protein U0528_06330 [Anaerolineae bacterium]
MKIRTLLAVFLLMIINVAPLNAQTAPRFDVFFDPQAQEAYFVEASTGLSLLASVAGSQHVLLPSGLLYQDAETGEARLLTASGNEQTLTWLATATATTTVRWVVSANQRWIGWVVAESGSGGTASALYTATTSGDNVQLAARIESAEGKIAYPLALSEDDDTLFYALQLPPNPDNYRVFFDALDVYALDVRSSQSEHLPNEPLCPCGVGFSADGRTVARLELEGDGSGFVVRVNDLVANTSEMIPAIDNFTHTQAGDVLVSDDGNLIFYASARGLRAGSSERYAMILVDRGRKTQTLLTGALIDGIRPVRFSEDGEAVIAVGLNSSGTYKLTLATGDLKQVSAYNWLGELE